MSNELKQQVSIPGSPKDVYELLVDSAKHAAFTGRGATGGRDVGDEGTAYDGQIVFVHRELVPNERIAQDWRLKWEHWPEDEWSHVVFELAPEGEGTAVSLTQTDVPEQYADRMAHGWAEHYWEPMTAFLQPSGSD
jgi:uncharacterized protein YndB with AHSA1/START domain